MTLIRGRESGRCPDSFGRYAAMPSLRSVTLDPALTCSIRGRAFHGARQRWLGQRCLKRRVEHAFARGRCGIDRTQRPRRVGWITRRHARESARVAPPTFVGGRATLRCQAARAGLPGRALRFGGPKNPPHAGEVLGHGFNHRPTVVATSGALLLSKRKVMSERRAV